MFALVWSFAVCNFCTGLLLPRRPLRLPALPLLRVPRSLLHLHRLLRGLSRCFCSVAHPVRQGCQSIELIASANNSVLLHWPGAHGLLRHRTLGTNSAHRKINELKLEEKGEKSEKKKIYVRTTAVGVFVVVNGALFFDPNYFGSPTVGDFGASGRMIS